MSDLYILRMRNHGFDLVGPFLSKETLGIWGARDQEERSDGDPRWQSLALASEVVARLRTVVRVTAPENAPPIYTDSALSADFGPDFPAV